MKPAGILLALVALMAAAFAAEESCVGLCNTFNPQKSCQCDSMCGYYNSCCEDFESACPRKVARGDVFGQVVDSTTVTTISPEEVNVTTIAPMTSTTPEPPMTSTTPEPTTTAPPTTTDEPTTAPPATTDEPTTATPATTTDPPTLPPDPDAIPCSGRPFDAFMQLKNGSMYAFRGEYFFGLDEKSVLPGYPKLIKAIWGIPGPIDAAFTRMNCQGKTYIFKGNEYWRFEDGVLDDDYPRDISVGFDKIPDYVDATFAIPGPGHHGQEKVYFFKGDRYYPYLFKHQPSHEECVQMSRSSPSVLFTRYTDLYCQSCDQTWDDIFINLFGDSFQKKKHKKGHHFISKDWVGIKPPVNAAMLGPLYLSPQPTPAPTQRPTPGRRRRPNRRRRPGRRRGPGGRRGQRTRQTRSLDMYGYEYDYDYSEYASEYGFPESDIYDITTQDITPQDDMGLAAQNVYFFKRDKYYRVDLQSKHVDYANPPYPRSIAKYWLGCKREGTTDDSRAEKR